MRGGTGRDELAGENGRLEVRGSECDGDEKVGRGEVCGGDKVSSSSLAKSCHEMSPHESRFLRLATLGSAGRSSGR